MGELSYMSEWGVPLMPVEMRTPGIAEQLIPTGAGHPLVTHRSGRAGTGLYVRSDCTLRIRIERA